MTPRHAIEPGQPILAAALPMPATGIALLVDVIERLYGGGEATIEFDTDVVRLRAPKDGFSDRVSGPLPDLPETTMTIRQAVPTDDGIEITYEFAEHAVVTVGRSLAGWFTQNDGINYVTARIAATGEDPGPFELTVRRIGAPAPERLHLEALERIAVLERQLHDAGITPANPTTAQED